MTDATYDRSLILAALQQLGREVTAGRPESSNLGDTDFIYMATGLTAGWEALTVTIGNQPLPGREWIVSRLTMHGEAMNNPQLAQSPISGLFLVPYGTVIETLADGQAAAGSVGWNVASRGIPLPAGVVVNSTLIPLATPRYAYTLSLTQSNPIVVPAGMTLRAVLSCNPGTLQPGPGAGSWGNLTAMGFQRATRTP